jgi:hypothetical protein
VSFWCIHYSPWARPHADRTVDGDGGGEAEHFERARRRGPRTRANVLHEKRRAAVRETTVPTVAQQHGHHQHYLFFACLLRHPGGLKVSPQDWSASDLPKGEFGACACVLSGGAAVVKAGRAEEGHRFGVDTVGIKFVIDGGGCLSSRRAIWPVFRDHP